MNLTGSGLLNITLNHGYILQILLGEIIYVRALRKRSHFALRLVWGTAGFLLAAVMVPNLIAQSISGFFTLTIFLLSVLLMWFLFKEPFRKILYCCMAGQLTQNLAYNLEGILRTPWEDNMTYVQWFFFSAFVMCAVYALCEIYFGRRMRRLREEQLNGTMTYMTALVAVIFVYFIQFMYRQYEILEIWVARLPLILVCILGLCMQFGWLELQGGKEEIRLLEQMIQREKQHYEMSRQSIDLINIKAHDLKHQLQRLKANAHMNEDDLRDMEEVIETYESAYKTGNATLDAVLGEKKLICTQNDIALIVMANGAAISCMSAADIASLFGNALDNAIECELKVLQRELRYISVSVTEKGNMVCIRVENYNDTDFLKDKNGNFMTTKTDRDYHGFGLKSIAYIAEKYHGTINIDDRDQLFVLSVIVQNRSSDIG